MQQLVLCLMIVRGVAQTRTCQIGDAVRCAGGGSMCAGDQCCKDGTPCPSASASFMGCKIKQKSEDCTDGLPGPSPAIPTPGPSPSGPTSPPVIGNGQSPALVWTSVQGKNEPAQEGLKVIKQIADKHVIDDFLAKYPEFKAIFWGEPYDQQATVDLAVEHAKKLCVNMDLDTWMAKEGFVKASSQYKKNSKWTNPHNGETLFAKPTHDFLEHGGPNNGFLRVFYQDVFMKLQEFNSDYGWNTGLKVALFDGKRTLTLVGLYSPNVPLANSPRTWVLPQMHYLGVLPLDLHHGNFGMVKGETKGVPVDLDATWRGPPTDKTSAFLKNDPINVRIQYMEREYHGIDHILELTATDELNKFVLSPSAIWSAALGAFLGSSFVIAAVQLNKSSHSKASRPLLG